MSSKWDYRMRHDTGDARITIYYKVLSLDSEDKLFWVATVIPVAREFGGAMHYLDEAKEMIVCFPKRTQIGVENGRAISDPVSMPGFLKRLKNITDEPPIREFFR